MDFFNLLRNAHSSNKYFTQLHCYSMAVHSNNENHNKGGKIIMPTSALEALTRINIQYPMLFKLTNPNHNRTMHCGVLEFSAEEGRIHVPYWMMANLCIGGQEGTLVNIENVSLPIATYAKFQPHNKEFYEIYSPKAVLENALRDFACLTVGDVIAINYNSTVFELVVLETKPQNAVSIIECDMQVDFAPLPEEVSSLENEAVNSAGGGGSAGTANGKAASANSSANSNAAANSAAYHSQISELEEEVVLPGSSKPIKTGFKSFAGSGQRLDGKTHPGDDASKKALSFQSKSSQSNQSKAAAASSSSVSSSSLSSQRQKAGSSAASSSSAVAAGVATSSNQRQIGDDEEQSRGIPFYEFELGNLYFIRNMKKLAEKKKMEEAAATEAQQFVPFQGSGNILKAARRKQENAKS